MLAELLQALEAIAEADDFGTPLTRSQREQACAALAKARGK